MGNSLLFTGFEPFGGQNVNASWEAVRNLDGVAIGSVRMVARRLPCTFGDCVPILLGLMAELRPMAVVCVGQAGSRSTLSLEQFARNLDDAGGMPDNAGIAPGPQPILPGGPEIYASSLPLTTLIRALERQGIPAEVSETAGAFVCNHLFYGLMRAAARLPNLRYAGFVHVPYLPEQAAKGAGATGMALSVQLEGLCTYPGWGRFDERNGSRSLTEQVAWALPWLVSRRPPQDG